jgi:hypothetical protein
LLDVGSAGASSVGANFQASTARNTPTAAAIARSRAACWGKKFSGGPGGLGGVTGPEM